MKYLLTLGICISFLLAGCSDYEAAKEVSANVLPITATTTIDSVTAKIEPIKLNNCNIDIDNKNLYIPNAVFNSSDDGLFIVVSTDDKKGFINHEGKIVVKPIYDRIMTVGEDMILVSNDLKEPIDEIHTSEISYISSSGEKLFSTIDNNLILYTEPFIDGYAVSTVIIDEVVMFMVIDKKGDVVLEPDFIQYTNLGKGTFIRVPNKNGISPNGVYEIINHTGEVLYSYTGRIFHSSNVTSNGFTSNDVLFFVDEKKDANNTGLMDLNGNVLLKPKYNFMSTNGDVHIFTDSKSNVILVNNSGEILVKFSDDYISSNFNGFYDDILIFNNGKIELFNLNGEKIKTLNYNSINEFSNGYATCMLDNKYGLLDVNGNEIVAPEFDYLTSVEKGVAFGVKGDETFRITFE